MAQDSISNFHFTSHDDKRKCLSDLREVHNGLGWLGKAAMFRIVVMNTVSGDDGQPRHILYAGVRLSISKIVYLLTPKQLAQLIESRVPVIESASRVRYSSHREKKEKWL